MNSLLGWRSPVVTSASQFKIGGENKEIVGIRREDLSWIITLI